MSLYVPEGTPPIVPGAMARIERRLPHPGEVLVREGARVEPQDIIARAFLPSPPQIVNVAQSLAIPPALVERAMVCEVGEQVFQGRDLARAGFAGARSCKAPVSGIVTAIDGETGYVTIAPDPLEMTMAANVRGVVMEILPHEGVVIETPAAQVYGVFGVGEERNGVLQLLVTDPDQVVTHEYLDARYSYMILIGGSGITAEALRRAVQSQVRGIIVGGIDEQELRDFLGWGSYLEWHTGIRSWRLPDPQHTPEPGLTLLVTEGFGVRPMSSPIFDLLSSRAGQEALIDGTTRIRHGMRRPRLVVSLARSDGMNLDLPRPRIRPEAMVRLLDPDHLGQVARVLSVPSVPITLSSGVRAAAVEVFQEPQPPFWVPRTAVEVLN
ncbi:MAG: hypothetical protein HC884_10860 [Chloroflexaceae bacterium]|nr:hypothetical protein [Chloroflexaceae bacterium]